MTLGKPSGPDGNEQVEEAISRLHPVLQEALKNAPVSARYSERVYDGEFNDQELLLRSIDVLNARIDLLLKALENGKGYVWSRFGVDLMNYIAIDLRVFRQGGMINNVMTALRSFAMTRLREELKKPSSVPFDYEEFMREQAISCIIDDILNPKFGGGEGFQGGGVG